MSRTYKTDPSWVKISHKRKPSVVKEYHDHRNGECDIRQVANKSPFWWQKVSRQSCGYDVSYYGYHGGFYSRPPGSKAYRREHQGRTRAALRKTKHDLVKLSREDIEDYDIESHQHRHSALWELY